MSYELHITRNDLHADIADGGIELDEWLNLVESDTELKADESTGSLGQYEYFIYDAHPQKWPIWYHSKMKYLHTKNPMVKLLVNWLR